jgi:hypothetical protein
MNQTEKEKEDILRDLRESRDIFVQIVATVPEERVGNHPGTGRWSVIECVEHVAVSEERLLRQMQSSSLSETAVVNAGRELAIRRRGPDRTKRVESPGEARPTGRFPTVDEGLKYFVNVREQTIRFVNDCNTDLRCMLTDHPIIGRVNCHEMLLMMAAHVRRHAKQIEETRDILDRNPGNLDLALPS